MSAANACLCSRKWTMKTGMSRLGWGVVLALIWLAGCERRPGLAEVLQTRVDKAELELAGALKALDKARADRDELERLLMERSEQLTGMKAELDKSQESLVKRLHETAQVRLERDRANAMAKEAARTVTGLQGQLRDKTVQVQKLERTNKDLQRTVQDLTAQVVALIQSSNGDSSSVVVTADANGQ